ncbi:MAG: HD domain-containing protein [Rikenellaceae bacterium]
MNIVNPQLREYLDSEILPQYSSYDKGHNMTHITEVATAALELAAQRDVNIDMVYTSAIFHDLGLIEGRDTHHLTSAVMLRDNEFLKGHFTAEQLEIIAEAIEDHRASAKEPPRSIYGEILSSADRQIDAETIIRRSYYYNLKHFENFSLEQHIARILAHIQEKYAEGGYLKVPILTQKNKQGLQKLRVLAASKENFTDFCTTIIQEINMAEKM